MKKALRLKASQPPNSVELDMKDDSSSLSHCDCIVTFKMVSFLVINELVREELLDEDETVFD